MQVFSPVKMSIFIVNSDQVYNFITEASISLDHHKPLCL